ncbi:hypothetical protein THAOC_33589 [Thalassiosira oceanica]|uniref:Uncharacterized protein n=1 Tax=Thalassiosira oceanica TaxID=159749 RepID=K0R3W8_THAOC|nr:hypothetical protein THAOC_33589 [Thalassiosira oceanica]|eukprot:EJK47673.1 hypothetical protein THAOC_33589 [Thalassiosira oceanica]
MAKIINVGNGTDRFSFHFNATSRIKSEQETIDIAPPIFGMIAADFCSALHVGSDILSKWGIIAKHALCNANASLSIARIGSRSTGFEDGAEAQQLRPLRPPSGFSIQMILLDTRPPITSTARPTNR